MIIQTIFKFIKGILGPKKKEYILTFSKKPNNLWYIDIPWSGNQDNLQMVGGSNKLLEFLNPFKVTLSCIPLNKDIKINGYFKLRRINWGWTKGAFYQVEGLPKFSREIWICPVTLCVLGYYPKFIYVKKI